MVNKATNGTHPKRKAILEAARALFTERGYEETTIADIARQAGIAVGTVYLYFRNKHDVYTAVALTVETWLADLLQDPALLTLPFSEVLPIIVEKTFCLSRENVELVKLLQADIQSHEENELHREAHERISNALEALFEQAIARGELAPFPTTMYAQMLNLMGSALLHQCFSIEQGEHEEQFRAAFTDFLLRLFFGPPLNKAEG